MNNKSLYTLLAVCMLMLSSCDNANKCSETYCPQGTVCENGFCQGIPAFADQEGNTYHEIQIGTQSWMQENLKTEHFRNGDPIATGLDDAQWTNDTIGSFAEISDTSYGKLYNWYAANDPRCLCPLGWHVPNDSDWTVLTDYLGVTSGGKLKSNTGWPLPNIGADNSTGFYGLPGKKRFYNGFYSTNSSYGYWWSSTQHLPLVAWARQLTYDSYFTGKFSTYKSEGLSIRCLKD